MIRMRTLVGICVVCALALSAFAAQGASASASVGTTAFTCVKAEVAGTLSGEHCLASGGTGKYKHVAIAQDTTTPIETTSENTGTNTVGAAPTKLKMTIAGVATELEATALDGEGWMENKVEPGEEGEHYAIAHGTITYTNVKVAKPAGFGCEVHTSNVDTTKGAAGVVHTTPLKGTTQGQGDNVKIEPTEAGGAFAHFIITGCKAPVTALNGPYTVSGSVTCPVNGATINCEHNPITTANTLKVNGAIKAGIEGSLTLKNKSSGTALSATTEDEPVVSGTTAFTCVKDEAAGTLSGEHCLASGGTGKYKHVAIAQDTTTEITGTTANTRNNTTEAEATRFKWTAEETAYEIVSTSSELKEGSLKNELMPNGEHFATASGSIIYKNVEVAKPAGQGCKIFAYDPVTEKKGEEGVVETTPLQGTTTQEGHNARISPVSGAFAHFLIEGCSEAVKALNTKYKVEGEVRCPINGATITCSHTQVTAAGTLKLNGAKAGTEGSLTLKSKTSGAPISATTVETEEKPVVSGTTAFTCVKDEAAGTLSGEHCLASGGTGKYKYVAIEQDTTTEITGTAEKTENNTTATRPTKLKMTIAGVATELEATALDGEGWMENKKDAGTGEHYAIAHGTITYTNVKVAKPAGLGCEVHTSNADTTKGEAGVVHTTALKGTTTGEGENVKIEPTEAGGAFAHFSITGCKAPVEALNGPYTVSGSVTCPVNGATINCEHTPITTASTLKVNGTIKAGIEGSLTLKNKSSGTALSATTVETTA